MFNDQNPKDLRKILKNEVTVMVAVRAKMCVKISLISATFQVIIIRCYFRYSAILSCTVRKPIPIPTRMYHNN